MAMRNEDSLSVHITSISCPNGFSATIVDNGTKTARIEIVSEKQAPGVYELPVIMVVDGESVKRTLSISVEEFPNDRADIVMDRTVHVPYLTETQCTYNPWKDDAFWN
jgi:hypothetical protein